VFGLPKDETAAKPKPVGKRGKRGKRKGAPGAGLATVENPDRVEDHRPGAYSARGEGLSVALSVGFARRQVSDVPLVTVQVTEHRLHKVRCDCGHMTAANAPELLAGSPTSYGPNLRALAVNFLVFQHVPVERTAQLIADLTGARVSTGWTASVLARAAELVEPPLDLVRALLVLEHVLHTDETTTPASGPCAAGCMWRAPST